jgi:septum formation protein
VVLRGEILGKPADRADAARMLRALSGTRHDVLTGVCVRRTSDAMSAELDAVVFTEVRFTRLTDAQIAWYVATGEPLDKAGAYALQGAGGVFVEGVAGSVSNVIGLPLLETADLLRRAGLPLPWERG